MSDLVVTVPKRDWTEWIAEGDAAGDPSLPKFLFLIGRLWGLNKWPNRSAFKLRQKC